MAASDHHAGAHPGPAEAPESGSHPEAHPENHTETLPDRIAQAVQEHPSVIRLHEGPFGVIASYLPGRKVVGVSAHEPGAPVEVSVVLGPQRPFPEVAAELREQVRELAGDVAVNVTVSDIALGDESGEGAGAN